MTKTLVGTPDPDDEDDFGLDGFYDGDYMSMARVHDTIAEMEKQFEEEDK